MTLITLRAVKGLSKSLGSFIVCCTIVTEALIATFPPSIAGLDQAMVPIYWAELLEKTEVKLLVHVSISTPSHVTRKNVQYTSLDFSCQQLQSAGVTGSLVVNVSLFKS